jgi:short-subunit dehydrogenase
MTGKTVLITGVSSGIGYETTLAFLRRGYNVAGTARDSLDELEGLQAAIAALPEPHGEFLGLVGDVRNPDAMQQVVDDTVAHFGKLHIVSANAGLGHRGGVVDAEWGHVDTLIRVNIDGVLHTIRAAIPAIKQTGEGGHVVFLSSVTYNMVVPYAAYYAASKAFISSIGRSLRLELEADNIGVTTMVVGRTATNFNRDRLGGSRSGDSVPSMTPDKVAAGIVRGVENNQRQVFMRFFDRLTIIGNILFPERIGRIALKDYK